MRITDRLVAVVFDLDGTLIDTMASVPTAYADTIHELGGPLVGPAEVVAAWHVGPTPVVLSHFLGRQVSADELECYYRHLELAVATVRPFPGVVELVSTLDRAGCRLGIFTSATRRSTTRMLAAAGLQGLFATVVCGDEVQESKPAPEGLLLACRLLDVPPAGAAYVGDAEVDLACARAAGAVAVHASWNGSTAPRSGSNLLAGHPGEVAALLGVRV